MNLTKSLDIGQSVMVRDLPGVWTVTERDGYSDRARYTAVPKNLSAKGYADAIGCATVLIWAENVSPYFLHTQERLL